MERERFETPVTVELSTETVTKAKAFANAVVNTVDYSDSNQRVVSKIRHDHFISKLGEEAVKKVFIQRSNNVIGPDYGIYNGKQKNWNSDLLVNKIPLAVKTQTKSNALKYGLSWTFQQSALRRDPILDDPEAWVCFVECDERNGYACTVYPPQKIKDLNFQSPRLSHLVGKKQVVYATSLRKLR